MAFLTQGAKSFFGISIAMLLLLFDHASMTMTEKPEGSSMSPYKEHSSSTRVVLGLNLGSEYMYAKLAFGVNETDTSKHCGTFHF